MEVAGDLVGSYAIVLFQLFLHGFLLRISLFSWRRFGQIGRVFFCSFLDQENYILPVLLNVLVNERTQEIHLPQERQENVLEFLWRVTGSIVLSGVMKKNKVETSWMQKENRGRGFEFFEGGKSFKVHDLLCGGHPSVLLIGERESLKCELLWSFEGKEQYKAPIVIEDMVVLLAFLAMEKLDTFIFGPPRSMFLSGFPAQILNPSVFCFSDLLFLFLPSVLYQIWRFALLMLIFTLRLVPLFKRDHIFFRNFIKITITVIFAVWWVHGRFNSKTNNRN